MRKIAIHLAAAFVACLSLLPASQASADLIATNKDTRLMYLVPLRNGLSAVTLVWDISQPDQRRITQLKAALSSTAFGGTQTRSAPEIYDYLRLKGISQTVATNGNKLLLTVTAPNEVFPETLVHLENTLLEPNYTKAWYARELEGLRLNLSSKTRRPNDILNEVAFFLDFPTASQDLGAYQNEIRFGRPEQVILRSGDAEVERRAHKLVKNLPSAPVTLGTTFERWASILGGEDQTAFALPKGIIHFTDPNASETLILLVKAAKFKNAEAVVGANLLVDYVGANQGSEMFRILRQDMRAAYAPRSDYIPMGKNRAIISVSATVAADRWPEIYEKMRDIYTSTRTGNVKSSELTIQHHRVAQDFGNYFFNRPVWGVRQLLFEFPNGASDEISLPVFTALEEASVDAVIEKADTFLPSIDEFLLVLVGGGPAPSAAQKSEGYCALPPNTPLSHCLRALSTVQN